MIDLYCERLVPGFWAEPVNALTNLSFLIAAFSAWRLAAARRVLSGETWSLILLIAAIGIGSFLFHTFATGWARIADVVPILLFQIAFLWLYGARVIGWGIPGRLLSVALLLVGVAVGARYPEPFNGSLLYAAAFTMLLVLGGRHWVKMSRERGILLVATAILALSLLFRSLDQSLCDTVPIGSHFLWHLLNGLVLYLLFRGLALNLPSADGQALSR